MTPKRFLPHVTVAAVIEENQRFLLVQEQADGGIFYNQPAGHLEKNETLTEAVVREVLEETAFSFVPKFLIGIYQFYNPQTHLYFLRFCFGGQLGSVDPNRQLDKGIIQTHWIHSNQLHGLPLRSPMVLQAIQDYQQAKRFPLSILNNLI